MSEEEDECISWEERQLCLCFCPGDGYIKSQVQGFLSSFKNSPVFNIALSGFLLDFKNIQIIDRCPEGVVHKMVDIKGSFKVLRPSEGKKIRVTVDLVTPSQVLARYRGIYEVVLTNDLSGSWLGAHLDVGQEVSVAIKGLSQTVSGKYYIRGEVLSAGEENLFIVSDFNLQTSKTNQHRLVHSAGNDPDSWMTPEHVTAGTYSDATTIDALDRDAASNQPASFNASRTKNEPED